MHQDKTLWPEAPQKIASSWFSVGYFVPVSGTVIAAREPDLQRHQCCGQTVENWSHYKFRQRLLQKAELTAGCTVILCYEPYTSKTCGAQGDGPHLPHSPGIHYQ